MQVQKEILKVRIREDLTLDYDVVNVRFAAKDEIEWHTEGGPVIIECNDKTHPFAECLFETTVDKPARSGPPVGGVGPYEYWVRSKYMAKSADPGVNIKP